MNAFGSMTLIGKNPKPIYATAYNLCRTKSL